MGTFLQKRNNTYYFRCRIPSKYQKFFNGKCEFKQSLLQQSPKNVLILSNIIKTLLEELFMLLNHADSFSSQKLVSDYINQIKNEIDNNYYKNNRTVISSFGKVDKYEIQENILFLEQMKKANISVNSIALDVQMMLEDANITLELDQRSTQYRQLEQIMLDGKIELLEYMLTLVDPKKLQLLQYTEERPASEVVTPITVGALVEEFIYDKVNDPKLKMTERAIRGYRDTFEDLYFVLDCENTLVTSLAQPDFYKLRKAFDSLPSNRTKKADTKDKNLDQILKMQFHPNRLLSYETKRKRMNNIAGLFQYALSKHYSLKNYAHAYRYSNLSLDKSKNPEPPRVSLIREDIEKLLSSPIYTDKADLTRIVEAEKFWIPLIALYSGMRQNEICQLYIEDVRQEDGVWYFNLNEEKDKSLKNPNAFRNVPIHNKLIELGLLEYYEKIKNEGHQRLWPNLKFDKRSEKYNIEFGKWFMSYFRTHVTEDKTKVFHSFRHTVEDILLDLTITDNVPESAVDVIIGHEHENGSNTGKRHYHSGFNVKLLSEVLNKIKY